VCRSLFDRISNPRALRSDYGGKIFIRNTFPCRLLKIPAITGHPMRIFLNYHASGSF